MRKFLRLRNIFIGIGIVLLIVLGIEFQDDYRKSGKFRTMQDSLPKTEQVDLAGLRDLPIAGGPILSLSTLKERLAPFKEDIIIVDGILSKHGYVNGVPSTYLGYFHNTPSWHHLLWRLLYTGTPRAHPEQIIPPFEEAKSYGMHYVNLQIGSKFKSPDKAVDEFITLFDTLPPHTKVYFHCHHGKGRTSMMLVMADIMKNAPKVALADIVKRQHLLGSVDLFDTTSWTGGTYATKTLEDRKKFIEKFYAFICQRKAGGIQQWSEWNSQNGGAKA
jgi:hypothetical protein